MKPSVAKAKRTKFERVLKIAPRRSYRQVTRRGLLVCGILSSLLYAAMNILAARQFYGYSSVSQTVSELSAIGAPTRQLWVWLGVGYNLLVLAFSWGIWQSAFRNRYLRLLGGLLFAYAIVSICWPFAPMHQRGAGYSLTDTIHIILAAITVLLMFFSIGIGAAALGKKFRLYSIATIALLFLFGTLTALDAPRIAANLPTPWAGIWERINIGVFLQLL